MTQQSDKLNVKCPGCGTELTISNAGGYQNYCESCVDIMPPIPGGVNKNGHARGYRIVGSRPRFKWEATE